MKRLFIYIFAVLPFACYSQTVLTLDECIRLAKENNKRTRISKSGFRTKNEAYLAGMKAYDEYIKEDGF